MSTIDNAKQGMGWVHQHARKSCGNCAEVVQEQPRCMNCKPALRCRKGGFLTNRFAICDQHQPMFLTGGTPK